MEDYSMEATVCVPHDAAYGLEYLWAPPKGAPAPGGRAGWHCQGTAAGGTWTPWAPAAGAQCAEVPWGIGSPAPPGSFLREEKEWKSLLWSACLQCSYSKQEAWTPPSFRLVKVAYAPCPALRSSGNSDLGQACQSLRAHSRIPARPQGHQFLLCSPMLEKRSPFKAQVSQCLPRAQVFTDPTPNSLRLCSLLFWQFKG